MTKDDHTGEHLQRSPAGSWVYRRRVPKDLLEDVGKREVKLTLKTKVYAVAVVAAAVIDREVEQRFEELRKAKLVTAKDPVGQIGEEAQRVAALALGRLRLHTGGDSEG